MNVFIALKGRISFLIFIPETTKNKRAKDPKKVRAGRAGAAALKAKMLEALRAAKESLRSSAVPLPS